MVALYRTGDNAQTIQVGEECIERMTSRKAKPYVPTLACVAMAHHRLGDKAKAESIVKQLQARHAAAAKAGAQLQEEDLDFVAEAAALIAGG